MRLFYLDCSAAAQLGCATATKSWRLTARKMRAKTSQDNLKNIAGGNCEENEGKVYGAMEVQSSLLGMAFSMIVALHKVFPS